VKKGTKAEWSKIQTHSKVKMEKVSMVLSCLLLFVSLSGCISPGSQGSGVRQRINKHRRRKAKGERRKRAKVGGYTHI